MTLPSADLDDVVRCVRLMGKRPQQLEDLITVIYKYIARARKYYTAEAMSPAPSSCASFWISDKSASRSFRVLASAQLAERYTSIYKCARAPLPRFEELEQVVKMTRFEAPSKVCKQIVNIRHNRLMALLLKL